MRKLVQALFVAAVVGACGGGAPVKEASRFDFGAPNSVAVVPGLAVSGIDVEAASWLASTAMQYRLQYADPLQRHAYAESRWAAPPGDLLATFLRRSLMVAPSAGGCRLRVVLDEFEQRFDRPDRSELVIEARASLSAMRGGDILARRGFRITRQAASADARGGAGAGHAAAQALAADLGAWTESLVRATPVLADRCRI